MINLLAFVWTTEAALGSFLGGNTLAVQAHTSLDKASSGAHGRRVVLRGVLLLTTGGSFFGLQYLPVGEFTAMMMLSPLAATALSAWLPVTPGSMC